MDDYVDSTDRTAVDFTLFGLAFFGYMVAVAGVILTSLAAALFGAVLVLIMLVALAARESAG